MTTVTEAQKKQIMIGITIMLTLLVFIYGIMPMRAKIDENKVTLANVEVQHQEMQAIVEDRTIETEYVKLREEYQTKFQLRFENFKSNEKIEAITNEFEKPIKSISIKDFIPVTTSIYENNIAQPKTLEELDQVRADEASPVFPLLLYSTVDLTIEVESFEEELMFYDAFNNIVPVGPGEADQDRFCILIPSMNLKNVNTPSNNASTAIGGSLSYNIYVFAMETMDLTEWDAEFEARKQGGVS